MGVCAQNALFRSALRIGLLCALLGFVGSVIADPALVLFTAPPDASIHSGAPVAEIALPESAGPLEVRGEARPGEFFVFQLGVAARTDSGPLAVEFGPLHGPKAKIPSEALRCLSLDGVGPDGWPFHKQISLAAGRVQAVWCGVDVPPQAQGCYTGQLWVGCTARDGHGSASAITRRSRVAVRLTLTVQGTPVPDHGAGEARRLARLRWLDSTVGQQPTVTQPFIPVELRDRTLGILGRELTLGADGMPARIRSFFSPGNTRILSEGREVLDAPVRMVVDAGPISCNWRWSRLRVERRDTEAHWSVRGQSAGLTASVVGNLDYTGAGQVRYRLMANRDLVLQDVRLEVGQREDAARFFMGLHHQGGLRPAKVDWTWDAAKQQDCWWLGDVNAGLMFRLKDAGYVRPPVNIYYHFRPLRVPVSWGNDGKGSVHLHAAQNGRVEVQAHSGPRRLGRGEALDFVFDFFLTPFRPIDTEKQWQVRFTHLGGMDGGAIERAVDTADPQRGPNVVNVHHASRFCPYINYPYADDSFPQLKGLVRRAHDRGVKLRVYYTTREITQNMPELLPLHSFNGEIILAGPGKEARTLLHPKGPHPWLVEHLRDQFIPAWVAEVGPPFAPLDLSVITNPDSRWNNFYLEGLQWLVDKSDLDGVYIDDTALDGLSLRRARRILDSRPGRLIDFHTWNHFNEWAGWASNLNLYMELLPYIDRLWIGEGFSANDAPWDFWLVEMSGLPFGLMSEMLDGPNPWKGLLFGETARQAYSGNNKGIWKYWDDFGIHGTEMFPFFAANCPVKTDCPDVRVTVYRKPGRALVVLGSWAKSATTVRLTWDWTALGLDPARARLFAPAIPELQEEHRWSPNEPVTVAPGKGWFFVLDETAR